LPWLSQRKEPSPRAITKFGRRAVFIKNALFSTNELTTATLAKNRGETT
jgi:hypothetical protein